MARYLTIPKGNNKFAKPSQYGSWSKEQYDQRSYGAGPSRMLTNVKKRNDPNGDYPPLAYRPLPYRLKWHKLHTTADNKVLTEAELIAQEEEDRPIKKNKKKK